MKGVCVFIGAVVDSSGKPVDGLLEGTLAFLGAFDECLDTVVLDETLPERLFFRGQYCTAQVAPKWALNDLFHNDSEAHRELASYLPKKAVSSVSHSRASALQNVHLAIASNVVLNSLFLHADMAARPYRAPDFRDAICSIIDPKDIISLGQYQMSHVWMITCTNALAKAKLASREELTVKGKRCLVIDPETKDVKLKLMWLPSHIEDRRVVEAFQPYGKVISIEREKWRVPGMETMETMNRHVTLSLAEGVSSSKIPYLLMVFGCQCFVILPGRPPLCLRCNRVGHIRRFCRIPRCSDCGRFGHSPEDCVLTYADKLKQGTTRGEETSTELLMDVSEVVEPTGEIPPPADYEGKPATDQPPPEPEVETQEESGQKVPPTPGVLVCSGSSTTCEVSPDFPPLPQVPVDESTLPTTHSTTHDTTDNASRDTTLEKPTLTAPEEHDVQEIPSQSLVHQEPRMDDTPGDGSFARSKLFDRKQGVCVFIAAVVDSSGKPVDGLLEGTLAFLGAFDECLDTVVLDETLPERLFFRGQYCTAQVAPKWALNDLFHNDSEAHRELASYLPKKAVSSVSHSRASALRNVHLAIASGTPH
ncbi:hypothetical protein ISCGN_015124 [Ixodes scapularis]